jgi:histone H3/H4
MKKKPAKKPAVKRSKTKKSAKPAKKAARKVVKKAVKKSAKKAVKKSAKKAAKKAVKKASKKAKKAVRKTAAPPAEVNGAATGPAAKAGVVAAAHAAATNVLEFVANEPTALGDLMMRIVELVQTVAPDARGTLDEGRPTYHLHGALCFFHANNDGEPHVVLGFPKGESLPDPHARLESHGGAKVLRLKSPTEVHELDCRGYLAAAAAQAIHAAGNSSG